MYKKLNIKSYQSLLELRKNPEKNIYVGAWDYLEKYKNDPDVYISFTEIDKIGINPKSKYNTPIGIYCYPLKEFYNKYIYPNIRQSTNDSNAIKNTVIKYEKSIGSFAPFAGNSKYINFIKCKDKSNFINDMYEDYGSNKFDKDINILKKRYSMVQFSDLKEIIKKTFDSIKKILNAYDLQTFLFKLGYSLSYSVCSEFFYKVYKIEDKKLIYKIVYETLSKYNDKLGLIMDEGINTAKEKNPIVMMWNITKLLAEKLSNNPKQAAVKWNFILSKDLGYSGFADKSGKGYIHQSEPMQAVFLNTRAFDLITREKNIPSKNIKT